MLELIKPRHPSEPVEVGKSVKYRGSQDQETMPVDFASYLLSSSPPGFDLNYTLREHFGVGIPRTRALRLKPAVDNGKPVHKSGSLPDLRDSVLCPPESLCSRDSHSDDDLGIDYKEDRNTCQHNKNVNVPIQTPSRDRVPDNKSKMGKKRVSFADDLGMNLVSVRLLTESSDTPPQLRPHILSSITQGATAGVTETPPLMLNFSQPASDYLAFREKIDKNCVCLENVILKDYNLIGTIKVKNISFEKNVKVRVTFDTWESYQDIQATFVPNGQHNVDTFAFEVSVPPNLSVRQKVQFCVCFQANCQEFWDSNDGANYEVVSANWKECSTALQSQNTTDKAVYNLHAEPQWSEYSGWSNMDKSCPYW